MFICAFQFKPVIWNILLPLKHNTAHYTVGAVLEFAPSSQCPILSFSHRTKPEIECSVECGKKGSQALPSGQNYLPTSRGSGEGSCTKQRNLCLLSQQTQP